MVTRGIAPAVQEHFRSKLRNHRKDSNMLQKDMADLLGVKLALYCHWETGRRFPTEDALQRIAKTIRIPYHELVGEDIRSNVSRVQVPGIVKADKTYDGEIEAKAEDDAYISWAYFHQLVSSPDAELVAYRLTGSAFSPRYEKGDLLFVETGAKPKPHDQVLVRLPEAGEAIKIYAPTPDMTTLVSLAPNGLPMPMPRRAKILGVVRGVQGVR